MQPSPPFPTPDPGGSGTTVPAASEFDASETVLLAVTGVSPAILTETIWALAREQPPVVPDRVVVITTARGRQEIERQLFAGQETLGGVSPWEALRGDLERSGLPIQGRLRFGTTADDVRVITTTDPASSRSTELGDIRTPRDNEAAADFILEQVRGMVENPDTRLVASLAGGRKTMGALLYACMTLIGREQDRLTHVLVTEPFETLRGFYFPGQPGPALKDRDGAEHRPDEASVELADVPFVPLRNLFERDLGRKPGRFLGLVEQGRTTVRQRAAESLKLTVDAGRGELLVNGVRLPLGPQENLILLFLARRAKAQEPAYASYKDALDDLETFRRELREAARARSAPDWRSADTLSVEVDERSISRPVSDLRRRLRALGPDGSALAACLPERGRCSLDLPGPMIHLIDP